MRSWVSVNGGNRQYVGGYPAWFWCSRLDKTLCSSIYNFQELFRSSLGGMHAVSSVSNPSLPSANIDSSVTHGVMPKSQKQSIAGTSFSADGHMINTRLVICPSSTDVVSGSEIVEARTTQRL